MWRYKYTILMGLFIALAFAILLLAVDDIQECEDKGGTYVKGLYKYECVEVKK